jgi:putative membrane protein
MKIQNMKPIGAILSHGIVVIGLLCGLTVLGDDQENKGAKGGAASATSGKSGDPQTCIEKAAQMNMATIKVAQLASQKAENAELKRFAQTLEKDHQAAQRDVQKLAATHHVTLPTALDDKCKEEISKLEALSGQEFDREFAKGAVEGHAMAIAHLQQASSEVKDADLRQYTQKMLAQVKDHQRQSREIAKTVGVDQATITSLENKAREGVGGPAARTESSSTSSDQPSDKKQQ